MLLLQLITIVCFFAAIIFWLIPEKWRSNWLLFVTVAFLAWRAPVSLLILSGTTISSYFIVRIVPAPGIATLLVISQNIGYFLLYKSGIGQQFLSPADRFIPLGLSYYAFRQIHYVIEWYKEQLREHTFWDYLYYLLYLPTLLAGPIHRFPNFQRDRNRRRWDAALISESMERVLYGYGKIIIIGNLVLGKGLNRLVDQLESVNLWLATYLNTLEYTLSAYFIFAGFSDVAIGISLLFGHRIMENFNYPFSAPNINEFWNRWHISLSGWVKDYVFIPIASMSRLPILGVLVTMLVIGLWHELSWRYIIWGMFHGLGIAAWHLYKKTSVAAQLRNLPGYSYFSILLTFHFVLLSFIFIREENWNSIQSVFSILFGLQ